MKGLVLYLRVGFKVSERQACQVLEVGRSMVRYRSQADDQSALRIRIRDFATSRVGYGYRRIQILLQRESWKVKHKRVYWLYKQEGLELGFKTRKKKRAALLRAVCLAATAPNDS